MKGRREGVLAKHIRSGGGRGEAKQSPPLGGIIRRYYASLPLHISLIIYINI